MKSQCTLSTHLELIKYAKKICVALHLVKKSQLSRHVENTQKMHNVNVRFKTNQFRLTALAPANFGAPLHKALRQKFGAPLHWSLRSNASERRSGNRSTCWSAAPERKSEKNSLSSKIATFACN